MIVRGVPSTTTVLPSTSGRAFKVSRQKSSLTIATAAAPARPSSSVKVRPRAGAKPSTLKKFQVICGAATVLAGEPSFTPTTAALPVPPATSSKMLRPNSRKRATVRSVRFIDAARAPTSSGDS